MKSFPQPWVDVGSLGYSVVLCLIVLSPPGCRVSREAAGHGVLYCLSADEDARNLPGPSRLIGPIGGEADVTKHWHYSKIMAPSSARR